MPDATFACPDLTTFCRLDELGLVVTGQRLEPDGAVVACRVADSGDGPDRWCRRCRCEGAPRDSVVRELAHEPNRSAIATLVERASGYTLLVHLPGWHTAEVTTVALIAALTALPPGLCRSLTWDRGTELADHKQIAAATGIELFFADPHSPWQRGSNENTNGLLRQYFPRAAAVADTARLHVAVCGGRDDRVLVPAL